MIRFVHSSIRGLDRGTKVASSLCYISHRSYTQEPLLESATQHLVKAFLSNRDPHDSKQNVLDSANQHARWLLEEARSRYTDTDHIQSSLQAMTKRVAHGEPLAYVIGM